MGFAGRVTRSLSQGAQPRDSCANPPYGPSAMRRPLRIIAGAIRKVDSRQILRQDAAPEHVHGDVRSVNNTVGICKCSGVRHLSLVRAIVGGQGPNVIRPAGMPQLEYAIRNTLTMTVEESAANREARAR